ncbi:MAG: ABC transporter permease [Actinobacteria bacterium]|nr:ABC transporter permease [Actinomycetota bacterium]
MKLANVAALYQMRLRAQLGQELLALLGIAVGVSLLFAALVANTSLTGSFERTTKGIVGKARYEFAARGEGFDERMLSKVEGLSGVAAAAGILEVRAQARSGRLRRSVLLVGVTPDFAKLDGAVSPVFSYGWLADVTALALPTPLVHELRLTLGQSVILDVSGHSVVARLGTKLQASDIGSLIDSPVAIAPLHYAQALSNRVRQLSRVFVVPKAGQDSRVRAELTRLAAGRIDVRAADFDAALFRQASQPTSQSTAMFSVFSAMVGFLFAFSAVLLTVPQRRQLIADLRTEGYGPRTIFKVLLFDALVLGVVASAVGIVAGDQLARHLFDQRPVFLEMAFAFGSERITTPTTVVIAAAGGVAASLIAVLGPMAPSLLRGADIEPLDRKPGRLDSALLSSGLVCLAAGIVTVIARPSLAGIGVGGLVFLTVAMLLLLPLILRRLVALLDLATEGIRSIVPFLAITDLRDPVTHLRSLAVAATGAVAIFGSVALQGAHADLQRGLDRTSADLSSIGDVWVVAPGRANLLATTPFRAPTLRVPPGVISRFADFRGSFLDVGDRRIVVYGSPASARRPIPRGQMIDGDTTRATRLLRAGGWAVVSAALANQLGLRVGQRFVLPSPVPTPLRVSALSTNMGWPPGAMVLNSDDYARAWGSDDVSAVHATLAPGVTQAEGAQELRRALGPRSGLDVQTAAQRERDQRAASREGLTRLTEIAALVLVAAMIAMAAAMAGMIWQRRAFLARMKVEGYSAGELWRSLLLEAAVLVGAGCAIGALFGLLGQSLLSRALTSVTGFPVLYSVAVVDALLSCAAVTLVSVAIIGVFGRRAASIDARVGVR